MCYCSLTFSIKIHIYYNKYFIHRILFLEWSVIFILRPLCPVPPLVYFSRLCHIKALPTFSILRSLIAFNWFLIYIHMLYIEPLNAQKFLSPSLCVFPAFLQYMSTISGLPTKGATLLSHPTSQPPQFTNSQSEQLPSTCPLLCGLSSNKDYPSICLLIASLPLQFPPTVFPSPSVTFPNLLFPYLPVGGFQHASIT